MESVGIGDIEQLVGLVEASDIAELTVRQGSTRITLRKADSDPPHTDVVFERPPADDGEGMDEDAGPTEAFEVVRSPRVGHYHAGDTAVVPGLVVEEGQTLGHVETMRLVTPVISHSSGVVREVLVVDNAAVEFGQELYRLEAAD